MNWKKQLGYLGQLEPVHVDLPEIDPYRREGLNGRPIIRGFTTQLVPRPVGGLQPRVNLLNWQSEDGLAHAISMHVFLNNAMDNGATRNPGAPFIPTAVIEAIAKLEWQSDAGTFSAEVDVHFGETISFVASQLTVQIVELSAPTNIPNTLFFSATIAPDSGELSSIQPQRTFEFFSLAGLTVDGILPVTLFVPNFARELVVTRSNDPAGVATPVTIRVETIPVGRRSDHVLAAGADLVRPINLYNGATSVIINSAGNPQGLNAIFLLDL